MTIEQMLAKYPLISDQVSKDQVRVILTELEKVIDNGIVGDIVEFGCYIGTTSLFIRRFLDTRIRPSVIATTYHTKVFHVYDSFKGLPEKTEKDQSHAGDQFKAGELAVSKKDFIRHHQKAGLSLPIIHKGWFRDLTDDDLPNQICFAFLDGDFYKSIRDSLKLVLPRMQKGGVIVVDDYAREALPGAARAVHEYLQPNQVRTAHNLGIIHF